MKAVFRIKSFRLLFLGNLVSEIGNSLYAFAIGLYILDLTGNALTAGLYLGLGAFTRVAFSPLAGVLVDKIDRIKVIYLTDFIRGLILIVAGFIIFGGISDTVTLYILFVVAFLLNVNMAFFGPAVTSGLPDIVGEEHLQTANAANSLVQSLRSIIGVLAGAIVYAFLGFKWIIIANAISFILSGISEMFIRYKEGYVRHEVSKESYFSDFKEGLRYIKKRTGLFQMILLSLLLNFSITPLLSNGIPYLFRVDLNRTELELAVPEVMFSASMFVAGIVIGSIAIKSIRKTITSGIILMTVLFSFTALWFHLIYNGMISFTLFYLIFNLDMVLMAAVLIFVNIPLNTGLMLAVHAEYRGRVFSTLSAISAGAIPIALVLGGAILEYGNITWLGIFCVSVLLIPTIGFARNKKVQGLLESLDAKKREMALQEEETL
ncbi:MAG: MFS transporter [Candidatus Izemoplasmataceae bacterium]